MRVRWTLKRYDEHLPHLDKVILTGSVDGAMARAGTWFWAQRSAKRYLFAKVRRMLQMSIEKAA